MLGAIPKCINEACEDVQGEESMEPWCIDRHLNRYVTAHHFSRKQRSFWQPICREFSCS